MAPPLHLLLNQVDLVVARDFIGQVVDLVGELGEDARILSTLIFQIIPPPKSIIPIVNDQICNKSGHSSRLCIERGNFAYVARTWVDAMSNTTLEEAVNDT